MFFPRSAVLVLALLSSSVAWTQESAVDLLGAMYWTHGQEGIYRAARDGSEVKLLVPGQRINSIAVDPAGGKIFWCTTNDPANRRAQVWRAKIDGSSPTLLAQDIHWAGDLVVDPQGGKLYVASLGDGKIIRIDVQGGKQDDFVTNIAPPRQLLVDTEAQKLYWTSNSVKRIDRINLDGSGREPALMNMPSISFGFALDPEEHCIYWLTPAGTIYCSKLDGTEHRLLLNGLTTPDGLALDLDNRKLYWTENGRISQANLDGTSVEVLVNGKTTQYSSLVVFPPPE